MEYDIKSFFKEHDDDEVQGFAIIETGDGSYRIAEKWNRPDGGESWVSYWVPEAQLLARVREGQCEKVGNLTDDQYEKVCHNTDERALAEA